MIMKTSVFFSQYNVMQAYKARHTAVSLYPDLFVPIAREDAGDSPRGCKDCRRERVGHAVLLDIFNDKSIASKPRNVLYAIVNRRLIDELIEERKRKK
jgi:hypothetical protein